MQNLRRFYALDSFRGVCALSVVVYHLHAIGTFTEFGFFRNADLFVEFFFVLSGFVLAHTYGAKKNIDFGGFFIARTFRLFPLHLTMLAVFIALEFGKLMAYHKGFAFNNEPFTGAYAPSEIIPNMLLLQSWIPQAQSLSFNYPAWSISVEYYMYMIFAAILLFSFKYRKLVWGAISVVAFLLICMQSVFLTESVQRGLSCFFAGTLSYYLFNLIKENIKPTFLLMTTLEIIFVVLMVIVLAYSFEYQSIVASVLFCFVVVLFAFDAGAVSLLLKSRAFVYLGKLSYSIYLTHAAILFFLVSMLMVVQKFSGRNVVPMVDGQRYIDLGSSLANNLMVLLVLGAVIAFSVLTHKYIEVRGQNFGKLIANKRMAKHQAQLLKS